MPEDIEIASFDKPAHADLLRSPVTSLDRHDRELGRRAAEMLLEALDGPNGNSTAAARPPRLVRLPLELRVRRSCGCPPRERGSPTTSA